MTIIHSQEQVCSTKLNKDILQIEISGVDGNIHVQAINDKDYAETIH